MGAFYLTSRAALLESNCRLSGRIGYLEMSSESYLELDQPEDWDIVEALLFKQLREQSTSP
jgi:CMP-N-acetylneuraminic acid synthetase